MLNSENLYSKKEEQEKKKNNYEPYVIRYSKSLDSLLKVTRATNNNKCVHWTKKNVINHKIKK